MNPQRKNEIKVGLVTIVSVALLIAGITLGRGYTAAVSNQLINIRFPNSGGIQESSPVMVNGVKRGFVSSIKSDNGSVLITVNIDNYSDLKEDATAKITILEITGGKKLEIMPGSSSVAFDGKKVLNGIYLPDAGDLIGTLGSMSGNLVPMVNKLDTIVTAISSLLADGSVNQQLRQTLQNTNDIMLNVKNLIEQNSGDVVLTLKNLKQISTDLKNVTSEDVPKVEKLFAKLDETVNQVQKLVARADNTMGYADSLLISLNTISKDVRTGNGIASRIIYDKELSGRLDSTLNTLQVTLEQIKMYGINANVRLGSRP